MRLIQRIVNVYAPLGSVRRLPDSFPEIRCWPRNGRAKHEILLTRPIA
jgi:hypothetical protein